MDAEPKPDAPDAFWAVDLRVGRVIDVEPFPGARKPAWKLRIDFGPLGSRQTSAQVTNYGAADLVDRLVVCAVNLGRKRIAGFASCSGLTTAPVQGSRWREVGHLRRIAPTTD